MPKKTFVNGEILTADDLNNFLMNQSVMVFADEAARTTAIPAPTEGMVTYLADSNKTEVFSGASFETISSDALQLDTFTAAGQIVYSTGAGSAIAIAGSAGQALLSSGNAVFWGSLEAGGAIYFDVNPAPDLNERYFVGDTIEAGFYWFEFFGRDTTAITGTVTTFDADMVQIQTATVATGVGQTRVARLDITTPPIYISFNLNLPALAVLSNSGSAQVPDGGAITVVTSSGDIEITSTSTVVLIGGGASGGGKSATTSAIARPGGGSGFITVLEDVPPGTYAAIIGAGGAGANGDGTAGAATTFGTMGTALGGQYANQDAATAGAGGSGAGGRDNQSTGGQFNARPGGINGANGSNGSFQSGGAGSGTAVPWYLKHGRTNPSGTLGIGGGVYQGGAAGGYQTSNPQQPGGTATGFGGGGGGMAGVAQGVTVQSNAILGGPGANGVILVVG